MLPLTGSPLPTLAGSGRGPQPSPRPAAVGQEKEASISFVVFVLTFFNTPLLQRYVHGVLEDVAMVHSTVYKSYKHEMNEHAG